MARCTDNKLFLSTNKGLFRKEQPLLLTNVIIKLLIFSQHTFHENEFSLTL
jgi:hypothetical protein